MSWLVIALASVVSGALGAMGLGGGGILLLVLVWAGMPQLTAQGVNLLMILPVGLLGLYFHRKNGLTEKQAALPLLWGGLPGVVLGVWLGSRLEEGTLRSCFGVLILLLRRSDPAAGGAGTVDGTAPAAPKRMAADRPAAGKAVGGAAEAGGGPQARLGGRKAAPQALALEAREKPPQRAAWPAARTGRSA